MTARSAWTWTLLAVLICVPILRLASTERQTFWQEVVTTSGLLALAMLVVVAAIPSRIKSLTSAFGIEDTLSYHRMFGILTVILILVHIAAVVINDPTQVALLVPGFTPLQSSTPGIQTRLLNPLLTPPARALYGILSTCSLLLLGWLASRTRGRYERWRIVHIALSALAIIAAFTHTVLINHLVPWTALLGLLTDPMGWFVLYARTPDWWALAYIVALAMAAIGMPVWRWIIRPFTEREWRVAAIERISDSVISFRVQPNRKISFRPGQFAWLRLHRFPLAEEHPFTISSRPQDHSALEFVIRTSGDWTRALLRLDVGDRVHLDGPHGSFTSSSRRRGLVLVTSGVGVTPILSMLRSMANTRTARRYPQSIRLIRADPPGRGPLRGELYAMRNHLPLDIFETGGRDITLSWVRDVLPPPELYSQLDFYICGPPWLISTMIDVLERLRISHDRIHTEQFDM